MTAERYYGPVFFEEEQIRSTFFNVFLRRPHAAKVMRGSSATHYFGPGFTTRPLADANQSAVEKHGLHRAAYRIRVKSKLPEATEAR